MKKNFLTSLFIIPCSVIIIQHSSAQSPNWLWAKAMGGTDDDRGNSIAIDPASGDVYTTGPFWGTVDFDPGAGVFNLTGYGGFISKLDASGNFIWATAIGGICNSIAIDTAGSGDVYTTGFFNGTVDFDPGVGVFNLTSAGNTDIFISKLDSSGNFVWAKAMGGTDNFNGDYGYCIALDASGNVYTTGRFKETVDFDPDSSGSFNLTSLGYHDIFISKLNSSGNFVWAKAMGGTADEYGISIAIDPAGGGDVYTTGAFEGTADFDPGAGVFNLTPVGAKDMFVSKLDGSGNFVWAKAMGGTYQQWGSSIAIDPAGSGAVYTTGAFGGTVDFDPGAGVFNLTSAGTSDIFISKLDSSGNFVWAKAAGGTSWDYGQSIAIDASGNVYVTGYFQSPSITFGSTTVTNAGSNTPEIFIAKLDTMTIITGNNDVSADGSGPLNITSIFPNPFSNSTTISFSLAQFQKVSLQIFDVSGRLVATLADKIFEAGENEIMWDAENVNAGIYFLKMQTGDVLKTEKLVVTK